MPQVDGRMECTGRRCKARQWVEIAAAITAEKKRPAAKILDRETKRVKFNRKIVITGELANRK
jgi:hypothetical protein